MNINSYYILVPMYNGAHVVMLKEEYEYLKRNHFDSFDVIL